MDTHERGFEILVADKAVLKPPQSRRSAQFGSARTSRQRLERGAFTAAFGQ